MTSRRDEVNAPLNMQIAVAYDCETLPNAFTLNAQGLYTDLDVVFEISHFRDDRALMFQWFYYWEQTQTPMVGFNSLVFDYPVIHFIYNNQHATVEEIYEFAMGLIQDRTNFNVIWQDDRFAPQVDLLKVHHFDNRAKMTSLKALEINMRSESVMECPLPFNKPVSQEDIQKYLIPYNRHDVKQTKKFAHFSMKAIEFRMGLMDTIRGDVVNFNDSKIGSKLLEQRLGDDLCYTWEGGRKQPRQSVRHEIKLNDIIFPYIKFNHPEFNRVLSWMREQTLSADEFSDTIKTKGVFTGVHAHVGGIDFCFGTGGIHGSVESQRFVADDEYALIDIDVASLYPNIAIVNRLYPEHLGERFVEEYARLPQERKEWQKKKGKKCVEANSMKLASNGTYGNSNNKFSVFYDPRFTMTITVNGQLLLCVLAEWLLTVPTLSIIQINTDGITYRCRRDFLALAEKFRTMWEKYTLLVLEEARYSRMWIRDVNSYVSEKIDGELKMKGAFWYPVRFPEDISDAQPPAWHKDFSAQVSIMAAVEHMVKGTDIDRFIYSHSDPFDFMCRIKVDRGSRLMIGDTETQRTCRYYVTHNGGAMRKISPPVKGAKVGDFKRKNGLSDFEYWQIANSIAPGTWDARIHTKNQSRYETREMSIESGYKVTACNVAATFNFQNVNYSWYIEQARKLVISE